MKYKIFYLLIFLLLFNMFSVSAANYGGNLKIKVNQRPLNLNPIYADNKTSNKINKQIFDTLVSYNQDGEIVENLAESWEMINDATIFIFDLRKDVYFHPYKIKDREVSKRKRNVTAEDWKWSFEYLSDPKNKSPYAELLKKVKGYEEFITGRNSEISGIKIINKYKLEIELEESFAPFINNLIKNPAVVMPEEAVINQNLNFSRKPVGTGSFKLSDFSSNKIVLTRNNNYWKNNHQKEKLPYLDQIEINFDNNLSLNDDYQNFDMYQLNSESYLNYSGNKANYKNYSLKKIVNTNFFFVGANYKSDLFKNSNSKNIKETITLFLDENNFIKNLKLHDFVSPDIEENNSLILNKIYNDLKKTKREKNIDNQDIINPINIVVNDSTKSLQISELMRDRFKSNKIELEINKYSWSEYLDIITNSNFNGQLFIMTYNYKNKFEFLSDNFYSNSESNYFNYENRRLDNLVDYLKLENSQSSRKQAYSIIENILIDDNPIVFLIQGADSYLVTDRIENLNLLNNIFTKDKFELLYFK